MPDKRTTSEKNGVMSWGGNCFAVKKTDQATGRQG